MAESDTINRLLTFLLFFSVLGSIVMGFSLIFFVAMHDYGGVTAIEIADDLVADGIVAQEYVTAMENMLSFSANLPGWLDIMFLLFFATFSVTLMISAYKVKRQGYYGFLTSLFFVSMVILFLSTYFIEISTWLKDVLFSAIPTITPEIPIFLWYLNNAGIINTVLIFVCLSLNFLDLDFSKFNSRKEKEVVNDEV